MILPVWEKKNTTLRDFCQSDYPLVCFLVLCSLWPLRNQCPPPHLPPLQSVSSDLLKLPPACPPLQPHHFLSQSWKRTWVKVILNAFDSFVYSKKKKQSCCPQLSGTSDTIIIALFSHCSSSPSVFRSAPAHHSCCLQTHRFRFILCFFFWLLWEINYFLFILWRHEPFLIISPSSCHLFFI